MILSLSTNLYEYTCQQLQALVAIIIKDAQLFDTVLRLD